MMQEGRKAAEGRWGMEERKLKDNAGRKKGS
jgi:hypothetical protein